jgi:hypothetical protein
VSGGRCHRDAGDTQLGGVLLLLGDWHGCWRHDADQQAQIGAPVGAPLSRVSLIH